MNLCPNGLKQVGSRGAEAVFRQVLSELESPILRDPHLRAIRREITGAGPDRLSVFGELHREAGALAEPVSEPCHEPRRDMLHDEEGSA